MNANELADELDYCYGKEYPCPVSKEAATMLRQQQAEIEALKEPKIPLLDQEIKFIHAFIYHFSLAFFSIALAKFNSSFPKSRIEFSFQVIFMSISSRSPTHVRCGGVV